MVEIRRAEIPLEKLQLPKTPSGLRLPCRDISESHDTLGFYVKYCKRYWATQMTDYGTTRCPEADQYINDHKLAWKAQAERSKIHGPAGDESEYKGLGDGISDGDSGMSEGISILEEGQMENLATEADYHESCRLLYAMPSAENAFVWDAPMIPILIRAEYPRIYDRLISLNHQNRKAIVTGQPGIGNSPCTVSL